MSHDIVKNKITMNFFNRITYAKLAIKKFKNKQYNEKMILTINDFVFF